MVEVDRIGRTVKVDETTAKLERGKYARLCVEVDLDKPLLPMFENKNHIYKIEYEGLHLLCLSCGKYGHYRDQCVANDDGPPVEPGGGEARNGESTGGVRTAQEAGSWMVVQKPRWQKKGKEKGGPAGTTAARVSPGVVNGGAGNMGSRFNALNNEDHILHDTRGDMHGIAEIYVEKPKFRYSEERRKEKSVDKSNGAHALIKEKTTTTSKPVSTATRATTSAPTRTHVTTHAPLAMPLPHQPTQPTHLDQNEAQLASILEPDPITNSVAPDGHFQHPLAHNGSGMLGPQQATRPPDTSGTMAIDTPLFDKGGTLEVEEFLDANDQGQVQSDSHVDMVVETPGL